MLTAAATLTALLFHGAAAQSSATAPVALSTEVPSITESTAIASATAASSSQLPSQAPIPPKQAWCPSEIFCAGPLLQTIGVANLFPDDKTFVDKPTSKSSQAILADFQNISQPTYGAIVKFVDSDFTGEGLELEAIPLPNFNPNPPFLNNVTATLPKAFAQTVHGFWTQLIRSTNSSTLCGSSGKCESTLIPLNHTFVVPGGRFREQYYWDSFWIVEGLIQSQLFSVANDTLQNFMDELEIFGFIPNGGRIYYAGEYIDASGDKGILTRALPLAEVTSPFTNKTFTMFRYAVNNTAPRPESYLADYTTVNSVSPALNDTVAESGWDYTTRFFLSPNDGLNSVNVRNTIGIDLNSILYKNHVLMASFYGTANTTSASRHTAAAESLKAAILDLFWDSSKLAFYDFSLTTNSRNNFFSVATFYPYWSGIIPDEVAQNSTAAFSAFSSVNLVLNRYNGTFPTTFITSGQQWDAPNAWPPHQYIVLNALRALPSNITSGAIPTPPSNQSTFALIPSGQLGLAEKALPGQPVQGGATIINATTSGPGADINKGNNTVANGGTAQAGEGWGQALQRQLANRVFTSILCSWQATGGSIPNILPRLPDAELNVTLSTTNNGNMFEKFSNLDVNSAGQGGEYTVQAGFGWTNGVLLWVASNYGSVIDSPICPDLLITPTGSGSGTSSSNGSGSGGTTKSGANATYSTSKSFLAFTVILATLLTRL
ncbi:Six-hairpin glycosidase-like protein [Gymnopilus junonius]|uniref:alpha,alpha-trehalase n=1 Tax=Gymnopilus junonius TaxID=109634 RepID=A0A9P5NHI8_GYMJU|nr:Six-hairpin glycosidase-like protein [Gymnopilus junonius]